MSCMSPGPPCSRQLRTGAGLALHFLGPPERSHADHRRRCLGGWTCAAPCPPQLGVRSLGKAQGSTPPLRDVAVRMACTGRVSMRSSSSVHSLRFRAGLCCWYFCRHRRCGASVGQSRAGVTRLALGHGGEHPRQRPRATKEESRHQLIKVCPQSVQHLLS